MYETIEENKPLLLMLELGSFMVEIIGVNIVVTS